MALSDDQRALVLSIVVFDVTVEVFIVRVLTIVTYG